MFEICLNVVFLIEHRFFLNAGHYVFEGTPYKVA